MLKKTKIFYKRVSYDYINEEKFQKKMKKT